MAHRHKVHARGGAAHHKDETHQEHEHEIESEAHMKRGGHAKHHKHGGKVHGHKGHHRLDKRARGGGVGSDKHPFSSAHIKGAGSNAHNPAPHHLKHQGVK